MSNLSKLVTAASLLATVYGHSWLHCSDYDGDELAGPDTFDEDDCNGYIRGWSSIWGATSFATDRGINYQSGGPNWCQSDFSTPIADMYDDGYPPASWDYGDEVTLVWPAKNHANYECMNNIPDTSMKLYYNTQVNPTSEPGGTDVTDEWTLLIDWQAGCTAGTDGCGFQNCPNYCEDTGAATCWQKYTVSEDDFPNEGYYTLMWYWIFNPGTPYTTCFEVYITGNNAEGGDDDSDEDSDEDSESEDRSWDDFLVLIPVQYDGADYDKDTLLSGANKIDIDDSVVFDFDTVSDVSEDGDKWNATIQTHTNQGGLVSAAGFDYVDDTSELCEKVEDEFGSGSCTINGGAIKIYGESSTSGAKRVYADLTQLFMVAIAMVAFLVR